MSQSYQEMIDFIDSFNNYSHFESDSHMDEISKSENLNNEHQNIDIW
jgi:hypothetical protein